MRATDVAILLLSLTHLARAEAENDQNCRNAAPETFIGVVGVPSFVQPPERDPTSRPPRVSLRAEPSPTAPVARVAAGWVPVFGASGKPNIWFYARGC